MIAIFNLAKIVCSLYVWVSFKNSIQLCQRYPLCWVIQNVWIRLHKCYHLVLQECTFTTGVMWIHIVFPVPVIIGTIRNRHYNIVCFRFYEHALCLSQCVQSVTDVITLLCPFILVYLCVCVCVSVHVCVFNNTQLLWQLLAFNMRTFFFFIKDVNHSCFKEYIFVMLSFLF